MNENIIRYEDLKVILGLPEKAQVTKVKNCLERNHIQYFNGVNGVWTTYDLINASKGLGHNQDNDQIEVI